MPGMVYQWRLGTRIPVDAQMAGEQIEHLRKKANGALTPAQVVDDARSPQALLHPAFEWDDSVAADRHREDQARQLIGCLITVVQPRGVEKTTRAFVNVTRDKEQGYTSLSDALSDKDLRAQVIAKAWKELEAWRERYETYAELAAVFDAMDATAGRRGGRRSTV